MVKFTVSIHVSVELEPGLPQPFTISLKVPAESYGDAARRVTRAIEEVLSCSQPQ